MSTSEEYRGPERRARNERDIEVDKRLADVEQRLKHVEGVLVNEDEPEKGMVAIVRTIRHDLGNNTIITTGTKMKVETMASGIENLLGMMSAFAALNSIAHFAHLLLKRILPVATTVAAVWAAVKVWWPK